MPYKNPLKGVYMIKAINSNIVYIGSSKNMQQRRNIHLSCIRREDTKRYCKALHEAFVNGDILEFTILELCDNYLEREQFYIDLYYEDSTVKLANVFDADRINSGASQEFRDKMSAIRKEQWRNLEYRKMKLESYKGTQFESKGSV